MAATTEQEWQSIQEALIKGGLRETIDHILLTRQEASGVSEFNRQMLAQAFWPLDGRFVLTAVDHYFAGRHNGHLLVEGVEADSVLYTIHHFSSGTVSVYIGDQIVTRTDGVSFENVGQAWDYIREITA